MNNRSLNKRTEGARNKALAEGIEIGRQESADKIEEQDQEIKEQKERINTDFPNNLRWRQRIYCSQINAVIFVLDR